MVEILVVVAVIGIISALVLPQFANIKNEADMSVARQQQAQLQTALNNWMAARSGNPGGMAAARSDYTAQSGAKLQLLQNYLQPSTYAALTGSGDTVRSSALSNSRAYLEFSSWTVGGAPPTILWINQ